MKIVESTSNNIIGIVKAEKLVDGQWVKLMEENNLVVDNSSTVLRDLMFGDADKTITKMCFGDMNLADSDDVKNVAAPNLADMDLDHQVYEKAVTKAKTSYENSPAIEYSCILEVSESNGVGSQLITEYGLKTGDNNLFSRKTRSGIYKDNESVLKFTWIIVFK